jgi:hypothetical protein
MQTPGRVVIVVLSMIGGTGAVVKNLWAGEQLPPQATPVAGSETAVPQTPDAKAAPATGASEEPQIPTSQPAAKSASLSGRPAGVSHARQFGFSIMPGTGYRVLVPYRDGIMCGDSSGNQSKPVCTHILPFFLELQLSYGIYSRLDFIVDLRFGIQKDPVTADSHEFALAPGFRYWLDQGVALKFYVTGQAVYDYVDYLAVSKGDFALRNADGIMYDAIRNVGFFFQVGWTMGFARWYRMELDAGLGVQVRFP